MTESEAKDKWCPLNSWFEQTNDKSKCIASDCMMWTWNRSAVGKVSDLSNVPLNDGYCGLTHPLNN